MAEQENLKTNANESEQPSTAGEVKEPQGWKDVRITESMPLGAAINFLNVLNQRLSVVEDNITIKVESGDATNPVKEVSLTEFYIEQDKKALAERAAEEAKKAENK